MLATSSLASFGYLCLPRNVSISSIFLLAWICSWYSLTILFTSVEPIMMSLSHSWLEICVFSLFFPWSVWLEFYQFYRYSKRSIENIKLWFCGFFSLSFFFLFSGLLISSLNFISFLLLALGFLDSSSSSCLAWKVGHFDFSSFVV